MQVTVPSGGHFLINSKGEHIPLGARVDVAAGTLRYVNAILGAIKVGIESPSRRNLELQEIGLWADDFTERHYDESEEWLWGKWDGIYEDLSFIEVYDIDEVILHNVNSDIGTLYELATHGLSKDEFIEKFKELAAEYEEIE